MPSQRERPGMFASHCQDEPCNEQTAIQSFTNSRLAEQHPTQRYYPDRYHRDLLEINAGRQLQRGHKLQNDLDMTDISQRPQSAAQMISHQLRSANKARRTRQVVRGVLYTSTVVSSIAETVLVRPVSDVEQDSDYQAAHLSIVDHRPLTYADYTALSPPQYAKDHPYLLTVVPHSDYSIKHPRASEIPHTPLSKCLPSTPTVPKAEPPDAKIRGPAIDPLRAMPWHDEAIYDAHSQDPNLPQELEASQPLPHEVEANRTPVYELPASFMTPEIHQPIPTDPVLSSSRSYLNRYRTAQQPAELDGANVAEEVVGGLEQLPDYNKALYVSPVVVGKTSPPISEEQQETSTPLYELYKGMRTWNFEDVTEAHRKTVEEPSAPPNRHDGGLEWFYGCKNIN